MSDQSHRDFHAAVKKLSKTKGYLKLQLRPSIGDATLGTHGIAVINEGRDGKFPDVSDEFYTKMVLKYHLKPIK